MMSGRNTRKLILRPAICTKLVSSSIIIKCKNGMKKPIEKKKEVEEFQQKSKDDSLEGGDDPNRQFQE